MNTKLIIAWLGILIAVFGFMWWAGSTGTPGLSVPGGEADKNAPSLLSAEEKFYDFGEISMAKGLVRRSFTVTNPTNAEIRITGLSTSCMCTRANFITYDGKTIGQFGMPGMDSFAPRLNEAIAPDRSARVEAVFDPAAHGPAGVGPIDRFIYLTDAKGGTTSFEIKAIVTP